MPKPQLVESLKAGSPDQGPGHPAGDREGPNSKPAKARKIIQTIQRTAAEQAIENAITVFNLEAMRSRIDHRP